jgi:AcrR family transcriptional regulator
MAPAGQRFVPDGLHQQSPGRYITDPPVSTPMPQSRQRRKEARPQELLQAALELFVEKGFAATRSEEVAHRAGVSKGTLYLYYPSKEELFKAVVRHNLTPILGVGGDLLDSFEGPTTELLVKLVERWWDDVGHTPAAGIFKLILAEGHNFPDLVEFQVNEVVLPSRALVRRAVQRGIARGEFRDVDIEAVVHALIAPLQYVVLDRLTLGMCALDLGPDGSRTFLRTHMDLLMNGLRAATGKAKTTKKAAPRKRTTRAAPKKET